MLCQKTLYPFLNYWQYSVSRVPNDAFPPLAPCSHPALTERLLKVSERRCFGSNVVEMGLQSPTHQQVVGKVCYVNAHDSKRVAGRKSSNFGWEFTFFRHILRNTDDSDVADFVCYWDVLILSVSFQGVWGMQSKENIYSACFVCFCIFPWEIHGRSKNRSFITVSAFPVEQYWLIPTK